MYTFIIYEALTAGACMHLLCLRVCCVCTVYVCMCLVISREKNPRDEVKCQDIAEILKPAHFYKKAPAWSTTGRKRDGW